jgi:hypothetical protein
MEPIAAAGAADGGDGLRGGGERPRDVRAHRNRPAAAADAAVKGSSSRRGERRVERRRVATVSVDAFRSVFLKNNM